MAVAGTGQSQEPGIPSQCPMCPKALTGSRERVFGTTVEMLLRMLTPHHCARVLVPALLLPAAHPRTCQVMAPHVGDQDGILGSWLLPDPVLAGLGI